MKSGTVIRRRAPLPAVTALALAALGATATAGTPGTLSSPPSLPSSPSSSSPISPVLRAAIEQALTVPGARLDEATVESTPARAACRAEEASVPRPVDGSGRIAVKLGGHGARGERCEAWRWVRVRVVAPVAVTLRTVRAGEPLDGAFSVGERELRPGHTPAAAPFADGTVAARPLGAGQIIERDQVAAAGIRPGAPLKVVVVAGALTVEQLGRAVPCTRGRTCAVLPSGKHVEGDLVDGRLVVQSP